MCGAVENGLRTADRRRPRLDERVSALLLRAPVNQQRGATLVEVVLFVLIIGIALSSVLGTLGFAVGRSADPLVQRQALAIAESLMQEIVAQPFTTDDPDGGADAAGPESGEARGSATAPFDHVNDYHGYAMNGVVDAGGTPIAGLAAYSAQVTVQAQALDGIAANDGLLITVSVAGPGGALVTLSGFRAR
jgi:MSHA pilin protein MshD